MMIIIRIFGNKFIIIVVHSADSPDLIMLHGWTMIH